MRCSLVVARGLGASALAMGAALTVALARALPQRPVAVLGRDGVVSVAWPLAPAILAAFVPAATAFGSRSLERTTGRTQVGLRVRSVGLAALASGAVIAGSPLDPAVTARSLAVMMGITYLAVAVLPSSVAWLPTVVYPMSCWLLGTRANEAHAAWAVPLRPMDDPAAQRGAAAVAMLGLATYLALGTPPKANVVCGTRVSVGFAREVRSKAFGVRDGTVAEPRGSLPHR